MAIVLFTGQPVTDCRIGNAILRKMSIENNFDIDNVYLNPRFKYVETISFNKPDADGATTIYKGQKYRVKYQSGCFNPYIIKVD